jgi:hypothetical protein
MPPKKTQPSDPAAESDADTKLNSILAQLASMNNNMEAINRRLDKVDLLGEQLNNIEESMRNISTEHANFKSTLASNQVTISNIQASQVSMDQYNRSWSVRIMELQLSADDESNPFRLVETVYNKVFLPILSGALSEDLIPRIPSCDQLLERAHVLPATKAGAIKPIICRFLNRATTRPSASASKRSMPPSPPTQEPVRDPATPSPSTRTCLRRFSGR